MDARRPHGRTALFLALSAALAAAVVPHRSPAVEPPASQPQTPPQTPPQTQPAAPAFDLPRLDGVTVDGDGADWAGRGFVVAVMNAGPPRRLPTGQFDGQLRLGWTPRGLLLLADVTDPDLHESESDLDFGTATSVEVSEADAKGKEAWHVRVSPGVDPRHPRPRMTWTDDRSKPFRAVSLSTITTAAKRTATGYVFEALFPWDLLAVDGTAGTEVGLDVRVYHGGDGGTRLGWSPAGTLAAVKRRHVRLADAPSPPVTIAADGGYEHFRRTRVSVAATADVAAKGVQVKPPDAAGPTRAAMRADGRLAVFELTLPMPAFGKPYPALPVSVDDVPVGALSLANADDQRRDAAGGLGVVATPAVFFQSAFPTPDFESPAEAEDLIGTYVLRTTYYDADYHVVTAATRPGRYGAIVEVKPEFGKPFKRFLTLYREAGDYKLMPLRIKSAFQLPPALGVDPAVAAGQVTATGEYAADSMRDSRWKDHRLAVFLAGLSETPADAGDLPLRLGPDAKDALWWHGLKKRTGDLVPYKRLVHVPATVPTTGPADAGAKLPLVLFLHGSGQRGTALDVVAQNGPPHLLRTEKNWPFKDRFILVSPQCLPDQVWEPLLLRDLLDEVMAKYPVDPDRVYLTGLSLGGYGTWQLAQWFPDRFAAIAPVCGAGDPGDVARIKDLPAWVFHGGVDPTVRIENAYEMVRALRDVHGRVRFTVYPEFGHNSWVPAYDDPAFYEWLLAQRRGHPEQPPARSPGTRPATD